MPQGPYPTTNHGHADSRLTICTSSTLHANKPHPHVSMCRPICVYRCLSLPYLCASLYACVSIRQPQTLVYHIRLSALRRAIRSPLPPSPSPCHSLPCKSVMHGHIAGLTQPVYLLKPGCLICLVSSIRDMYIHSTYKDSLALSMSLSSEKSSRHPSHVCVI